MHQVTFTRNKTRLAFTSSKRFPLSQCARGPFDLEKSFVKTFYRSGFISGAASLYE
jgi:hypothetical protein